MNLETNCAICNGQIKIFDKARIMNKYDITYYRCEKCGFIHTEKPYWLDEAYSSAIANSDIGILQRNINITTLSSALFKFCFRDAKDFLDWGGGYGIYVRMMRDKGFDFEWYDKYCKNLFAKGQGRNKQNYDVITGYEMIEHEYDPVSLFFEIFRMGKTFVFTTELNTFYEAKKVSEWWYYCTDHGQHVSIYTKESLKRLAERIEKRYYSCGALHIFTDKQLNQQMLNLIGKYPSIIDKIMRYPSLLISDYKEVTGVDISKIGI